MQLCEQPIEIERLGGHSQLTADARPFVSRAIAIEFDAVAVGIAQVNRLAHAVVGSALDRDALIEQALERAREFAAIRIKNCKMIKPCPPVRRLGRAFPRPRVQADVMMIPARREKDRVRTVAIPSHWNAGRFFSSEPR